MTDEQETQSKLLDREEVHFVIDYWDGQEKASRIIAEPHTVAGASLMKSAMSQMA